MSDIAPKPWDEFFVVISGSKSPLTAGQLWYDEARYSRFYNNTRPDLTILLVYLLQLKPYVDIDTNRMVLKPALLECSNVPIHIIFEFLATQKLNVSKILLEKLLNTFTTYSKVSVAMANCLNMLKENLNDIIDNGEIDAILLSEDTKKNINSDKFLRRSTKRKHSDNNSSVSKKSKCEIDIKNENEAIIVEQILQQIGSKNCDKFIELLNADLKINTDIIIVPEEFLVEVINKYNHINAESQSLKIFLSSFCVSYILKLTKASNRILTNSLKQLCKIFSTTFVNNFIIPLQLRLCNLTCIHITLLSNLMKFLNADQQRTIFCAFLNQSFDECGSKLENVVSLALFFVNLKLKLSEKEIYFVLMFLSQIVYLLSKSFPFSKLVLCFVKNYKSFFTEKHKLKLHDIIDKIDTNLKSACLTLL